MEHWLPPEVGWLKVNVDGAFLSAAGYGGCGVVLRDHYGDFVAADCRFLTQMLSGPNY